LAYLKAAIVLTLGVYISNRMIRICKISTNKHVVRSLCNSRASCQRYYHFYSVCDFIWPWKSFKFNMSEKIKHQGCFPIHV